MGGGSLIPKISQIYLSEFFWPRVKIGKLFSHTYSQGFKSLEHRKRMMLIYRSFLSVLLILVSAVFPSWFPIYLKDICIEQAKVDSISFSFAIYLFIYFYITGHTFLFITAVFTKCSKSSQLFLDFYVCMHLQTVFLEELWADIFPMEVLRNVEL